MLLSLELTKKVKEGEVTWEELINGILSGEREWDRLYNQYIEAADLAQTAEWHIKLILQKEHMRNYGRLSILSQLKNISELVRNAKQHDLQLAAWYQHLCGFARLCEKDNFGAYNDFDRAANICSELGRPLERVKFKNKDASGIKISNQARRIIEMYKKKKDNIIAEIEKVDSELIYGPETKKAEEALRILGQLLGLNSQRPDNTTGTGPDVTWEGENDPLAFGFELKTDK